MAVENWLHCSATTFITKYIGLKPSHHMIQTLDDAQT